MLICDNCNRDFKNKSALVSHIKNCLSIETINSIIEDYRFNSFSMVDIIKKYKVNKKRFLIHLRPYIRSSSDTKKLADKKYPGRYKHTEESKQNLREKRLKWMKENPEKTAWRQSNLSYPEKLFLDKIAEKGWDKKYLIIREKSFFPYFIDFAFEDFKVAVEIDGSQHNNPDRKLSDEKKDNLLISNDWRVIRITSDEIKNNISVCFDIIENIISNSNYTQEKTVIGVYKDKELKKRAYKDKEIKKYYCSECGNIVSKESNRCNKCANMDRSISQRKVERPSYEQLLKEIEDTNYVQVGKKYGVSDNAVRKWLKKYKKWSEQEMS
jgi:very-short-patch-repair endonuclease